MKTSIKILMAFVVIAAILFVVFKRSRNSNPLDSNHLVREEQVSAAQGPAVASQPASSPAHPEIQKADQSQTRQLKSASQEVTNELTEANFESFVQNCFRGETCRLVDDPLKMYKDFKIANNRRANDQLISFMRKNLADQEFKLKYQDSLKKMIDDFYPPEEKQFQDAAFYNYAGDLAKSLELYQDLEKRSQTDATLRPAPPLNIANVLYDMQRFAESLPYYEAARSQYSGATKLGAVPDRNEMLRFIDERIADIAAKTQN